MIEKQAAYDLGVNVIESDKTLFNAKDELIEQLKGMIPNVINADGQIDTQALSDLVDAVNTTSNNQGYELTFAGKGLARAKADEDTTKELKYVPEQSKDTGEYSETENVIIRGDNIDALKVLYKNYHNSIKMIYIDPPYNTKSENFVYNDDFRKSESKLIEDYGLGEGTIDFLDNVYGTRSHSGWLSFMYPRLKLARELLNDEGVIFISIDDNEQANLKVICDEIFSVDNFIAMLSVENNPKGRKNSNHISLSNDYVLVYGKNKNDKNSFFVENMQKDLNDFNKDEKGRLYSHGKRVLVGKSSNKPSDFSSDKHYSVYYNRKTDDLIINKEQNFDDLNEKLMEKGYSRYVSVNENHIFLENTYTENAFVKLHDNKALLFKDDSIYEKDFNTNSRMKSLLINNKEKQFDYKTETAGMHLKKIGIPFSNPKNVRLIQTFMTLYNQKDYMILDFFAGSGTTGEAVTAQNAKDHGTRKFILCQLDELIDKKNSEEAYEFCKNNNFNPVISSITIERVNRAGDKVQSENPDANLDIGYKVYTLTDKPVIRYNDGTKQLELPHGRASHIDTLINMLVATVKPLHTKIIEIKPNAIYKADDEIYVIGGVKSEDLESYKDKKINIDPYAEFALEDYLNLDIANKENVTVVY